MFKAAGVTGLQGHGKLLSGNRVEFTDKDGKKEELTAKHVVLAAGSAPTELRACRSMASESSIHGVRWSSMLCRSGSASSERASSVSNWAASGAGSDRRSSCSRRSTTFLPIADGAVSKEALRHFKKLGLDIRLGAKVSGAEKNKSGITLKYSDAKGEQSVEVDKVVVAIGRRPYSKDLIGEGAGVQLDERGFVKVDHDCRTEAANVWAVGDLVRGPMLAHKGKEEGVMVADLIAGKVAEVNYKAIPSVIYTAPEIAWVGQTEEEVKASGRAYKIGSFPFLASGRARAMEATAGFCKIVSAADDDEVLGVHIIGPMAGELIAEAVLAMEYSASTEDIQRTMHAHPTLSEAMHEAALNADKIAIDFPNR